MDYVRLRALPAPSTEEHACDVPLNVSKLESAAPDAAEQTPKPIIFDKIPIHRSSRSIKPTKIRYYTSASKDWYQKTTVVGHNIIDNRLADTQLRRLRFWTYTRNFTGPSPLTLYRHCQQVYDPVHYLLNCPAYPKHRRILKSHLRPEYYKLPDRHLAALLIRKSTFLPDIITPLLQKDPYIYQGQIRPPLWTSG
ncbi:hypothetical protein LSH36_285g00009 [Paralvinella palmiformis]|uniref:Uncharacterized protein n=1 Tax=Paralvinella palmiformis TaxID=53620 RepID=A0AAD9JIP5_9ANNE|nr:hypothetical protein LSH36_285g00009 [Paralvinella palmiformis]